MSLVTSRRRCDASRCKSCQSPTGRDDCSCHYGVPMFSELELVQRQVDAFNAHNLDGFLACYADDAVVRHGDGRALMTGKDEMRDFYGPTIVDAKPRAEIVNRVHSGAWLWTKSTRPRPGRCFTASSLMRCVRA